MRQIFNPGDTKWYRKTVSEADSATFDAGQVHPVYATFALARDAEWTCRLFVLDMKEEDEEGIGTFVSVFHVSPALIGGNLEFEASIKSIKGNELICTFKVTCGDRLIAHGEQGQKILKKTRLETIFSQITGA